jgi:hypothetical protein
MYQLDLKAIILKAVKLNLQFNELVEKL